MSKNFEKCTFLIPFMNACFDREFNLKTVLRYLNENIKTNIFIVEQVSSNKGIVPIILNFYEYPNLNITHHRENINDDFIHKTKLYNIGLSKIKTDIISPYDSDVLIPIEQMLQSINDILDLNTDYSYPFSNSYVEILKHYSEERDRLLNTFDFKQYVKVIGEKLKTSNQEQLYNTTFKTAQPPGGCMFIKRNVYIDIGMENELFVGYGPEDVERKMRLEKLKYKCKPVEGSIFHIEHDINKKRFTNPIHATLFKSLDDMSEAQLIRYYNDISYKTKYGCN